MRSRVPSTTLACTFTVSPARSAGTFAFCCSFSSCWMTFISMSPRGFISVPLSALRVALRRLLLAPLADSRVVARQQDIWNSHAAKLGGPRELRAARQLPPERVVLERVRIADHAGHQPRHRVDQHHRWNLRSAEHVVADRDLPCGQAGAHAVVDALVAPTNDDESWFQRQLGGQALVEAFAPWLHENDRARVVEHHALHRFEDRLGLQHHAGPAAEGNVVDLPVPVVRELAQVVGVQLEHAVRDRPTDHALVEAGPEHAGEDGHDVELHRASSTVSSQSATTIRPASRSTVTTASFVAGIRCSSAPSRLTHTSLAGFSSTSSIRPRPRPDAVTTSRPISWWW